MADNFKIENCLGFIANRMVRVFQKALDEKLLPYGLTSAQFCVLAKLFEDEGLTQTELANRLFIESPTLVRTLDRMEASKIIERRRDPGDRRAYHIYLLPKGRGMRDMVDEVGNAITEKATAGLTKKELDNLRRFLRQIWKNLE